MVVDDEDMVVTSVRAYLQLETEYRVQGFTEPLEAAKYLELQSVDVIISDYMMPKMSGLDLLAKAKQLQPEAARVLLTGQSDKQTAIQAINEIGLFQYLEKPWDNSQLLLVVNSAIERTQLLRSLQSKITELDSAHSNLKNVQSRLLRAFL